MRRVFADFAIPGIFVVNAILELARGGVVRVVIAALLTVAAVAIYWRDRLEREYRRGL